MRTVSPELTILDESGFEASLGEVARSAMPLRVPVGVTGDEVLHAPRQVGLGRTEEKAEVVGHEHETQQVPTEPSDRLLQSLEQPLVITFVLEDAPSLDATGHHVMDRARVFDPQWSGHGPILPHGARRENRKAALAPQSTLHHFASVTTTVWFISGAVHGK